MKFKVYGPFKIPRDANGRIPTKAQQRKTFWDEVEGTESGLSSACGCYVFTIKPSGGGRKPWYVGMTGTRQLGFRGECFGLHQLALYNDARAGMSRGTPELFLIAKLTQGRGVFAKPGVVARTDLEAIEKVLIGMAFARNRKLLNVRGTKLLKAAEIPGVLNSPAGNRLSAQALRNVLGA
jgi:hypothetical protein